MRKQYHFWPGEHGLDAWDVDRLVEMSASLAADEIPVASITEIDSVYGSTRGKSRPFGGSSTMLD